MAFGRTCAACERNAMNHKPVADWLLAVAIGVVLAFFAVRWLS